MGTAKYSILNLAEWIVRFVPVAIVTLISTFPDISRGIGFAASEVAASIPFTSSRNPRLSSPLQPAGGAACTGVRTVDHRRQVIVIITRK